jgi:hypothetical protein
LKKVQTVQKVQAVQIVNQAIGPKSFFGPLKFALINRSGAKKQLQREFHSFQMFQSFNTFKTTIFTTEAPEFEMSRDESRGSSVESLLVRFLCAVCTAIVEIVRTLRSN